MAGRERTIRTNGIVLNHRDLAEADRLLTLFTEHLGKTRAIAKGVRKLRSRKAGHLEPFTLASIQLARGRDLYIVTQAETINAFLQIKDDLDKIGLASYVIELLDRFTYDGEAYSALLRLVVRTLERLEQDHDPGIVLRYYEIRLLDLLGFRPELQVCVSCGKEIKPQDQYFSAEHGGVMCPQCGGGLSGVRPVSLQALKYLRHFQRSNYEQAQIANPGKSIEVEMEIIMHHYLTYLLERNLNTPAFLRMIRKEIQSNPNQQAGEL